MSIVRSLGHILLSGIFITGGAQAFMEPGGRVNKVAQAGIPGPRQAVELNGAAMVIGGTLLGLSIAPKLGATILIGTIVPTTIVLIRIVAPSLGATILIGTIVPTTTVGHDSPY